MSFLRTSLCALALVSTSLLGCEFTETNETGEIDSTSQDVQITRMPALATYYVARIDTRRCASPMCGGIFVSAANQSITRCARGSYAQECYVSNLDFSLFDTSTDAEPIVRDALGPDLESTRVVLLGTLQPSVLGLGTLRVQMAWIALETHRITGELFDTRVNGLVCVVAPCPSYDQELLNRGVVMPFHGFDFADVPEHASDGTFTVPALNSDYGMIVAGENIEEEAAGPAGHGTFLKASQIFIPVGVSGRKVNRVDEPPIFNVARDE